MARTNDDDCKRRFRRRTLRVMVDYQAGGSLHCEYATTLGAGGMFIETDEALPLGAEVKTRFRLPNATLLHEVEGRVVWRLEPAASSSAQAPGMGVEFTDAVAIAGVARELAKIGE